MKKQKFNETNGVAVKGVNGNTEYIRGSFLVERCTIFGGSFNCGFQAEYK